MTKKNKVSSKELRQSWINFYLEREHKEVFPVSLISDGATGVLFNVAGMQPIMPYLLGKKHPLGNRLVNIQGCLRTNDIDEVGDNRHLTFFEMMGSWSLGDYFKEERCNWSFEILNKIFGFPADKIAVTVFEGNGDAKRDDETAMFREKSGIKKENIYFLPKKENWWELEKGPCGPDSEMFYITDKPKCSSGCNPSCDCGKFIEIGNDVFMQYEKVSEGKYLPLKNKNVDTGFGFERNLTFLNGTDDVFETDLFADVIIELENLSGIKYEESKKAFRIVSDHVRTAVMLIGDEKKLVPSNTMQGYILRRIIRRAVRYLKELSLNSSALLKIAQMFIDDYSYVYKNLKDNELFIKEELLKETEKFSKTLEQGLKEFNKLIENLQKYAPQVKTISGDKAFRLFDTFGFPLEITEELAKENGYNVDKEGFDKAFERHREKSGAGAVGVFKGGLADSGEETTKLHTATHLLHAALSKVLKSECKQSGSNINAERLRFDFTFDRKLEAAELKEIEKLVNQQIEAALPVSCEELTVAEAKARGAIGVFDSKYGEKVKVYSIGNFSLEICGGPHVKNTKELGKFKIIKEESSSAGIRRIKAILEK